MYRDELEPDSRKVKKNETHPIYSMKYLLHRRITVEEPHKRNGVVQCINCQEFGYTKTYYKLRSVCVACGDLHSSFQCEAAKQGLVKTVAIAVAIILPFTSVVPFIKSHSKC